ncbi:hypothetical protein L7D48_20950 [Streptomyces sp. S1A]|uniref:Asp23/Gls24 family envelope stress response protein n=1 Tax=Streptomyces chitinivorans TaxID=1257027 RepID=A0ABW7HU56_9ACTN|nr:MULTISPECIES: hypothetical protein [Streptomyces]MCG3043010.1 hypothetical protein [Streptomyces sp. ICN903]MDH2410767.1 hypothetical protein [Streptomyces chitinivorans]
MAQEFRRAEISWVPPAERGATRIADRVVAKIAARAAREALDEDPGASGAPRAGKDPRAKVAVRRPADRNGPNGEARVVVAVELPYPCDIGARCGSVRRRVASRVRELAGMAVRQVTVEVTRLHTGPFGGRSGGRVR